VSQPGLRPIKRISASQAVAEQIVALVNKGLLKPGERLPPERELVNLLKAGRTSVREALRGLASLNIIEIHAGKGTYVRELDSQSVLAPATLSRLLKRETAVSVAQTRRLIEPEVAALAAEYASEEDLRRIRQSFEQMALDQASRRRDASKHLDFHRAIAEATHNQVLVNIEHYLIELVGGTMERWVSDWSLEEAFAFWGRTLEEHRAILEGLERHDAVAAREAARAHLVAGEEYMRRGEIDGHPLQLL